MFAVNAIFATALEFTHPCNALQRILGYKTVCQRMLSTSALFDLPRHLFHSDGFAPIHRACWGDGCLAMILWSWLGLEVVLSKIFRSPPQQSGASLAGGNAAGIVFKPLCVWDQASKQHQEQLSMRRASIRSCKPKMAQPACSCTAAWIHQLLDRHAAVTGRKNMKKNIFHQN